MFKKSLGKLKMDIYKGQMSLKLKDKRDGWKSESVQIIWGTRNPSPVPANGNFLSQLTSFHGNGAVTNNSELHKNY